MTAAKTISPPPSLFNETFFGILLHSHLKHISAFQYAEERFDYVVPDRYTSGYKTRMSGGKEDNEFAPSNVDDDDDPYLIDWYSAHDHDNPYQWSSTRKTVFMTQIMLLTTSVYMGSSIVSPAIPAMSEYWNVGLPVASLSISLFVLGYSVGPMCGLAAVSEIPNVGRTIPYIISLTLFVILQIPTALIKSIGGYMVLRFLAGFFGSPPLATGGASVQDVWRPESASLAMGLWGISAAAGPVLGPVVGGFAVQGFLPSQNLEAWRWTIWPLLMLTGFTLALLLFTMPETSSSSILTRRAARLRTITGNPYLRSKAEVASSKSSVKELAVATFARPFRLGLLEPIALSINLHIGLVYGVLYSFFESFPIAFSEVHHFNLGETGLAFMGIFIAVLMSYAVFAWYFIAYFRPKLTSGRVTPELWLQPALVGGICLPLSLFAFGWTVSPDIHWIVPILASMLFAPGIYGLFAAGLNYLAFCYGDNVASAFAANDFTRGVIGAAMPLVSRQMFVNLNALDYGHASHRFPVAWGCTLLGGIAVLMAPVPFVLMRYGAALRRHSKYAHFSGESHTTTTSASVPERHKISVSSTLTAVDPSADTSA